MRTAFKVLGPLEVWRDGEPVQIPAGRTRVLLASLLLRAGETVSVDTLVERLWDGAPPSPHRARATLHMAMTRLRQALGESNVVRTTPNGYVAEVGPDELDLHAFRRLAEQGRFADALALYRGEPLSDVRSDVLHAEEVEPLLEERLTVLERRIDADLDAGRSAELVAELRALTTRHPLRERFWGQLMLALSRSGRQADALATYRAVTRLLDDELGVAPGPELREVHQTVLSGAPHTPPWPLPRQLPPDIADFVGREDLHREVTAVFTATSSPTAVPIAVVTGPPGSGKSALTVHLAHRLSDRFPDGQLFVRLGDGTHRPRDTGEVLAELLAGVGVGLASIPEDVEARAAAFRSRIAGRAVLLVLDGAADLDQVRLLLPGGARCAVLVSSRHHLAGLPGSRVLRLDPLDHADALRLLSGIIGADRVDRERTSADAVVEATGGLPLALRIVGARLATRPSLPLSALAVRLSDERRRLDELSTADMEVRAGFELSYAALDDHVALAFRRLGLLGPLDFAAWSLSVLTDGDGERLVEELVNANLVQETGVDATGEARYRLHDLLAVYAAELVAQDDPADNRAHLRRHAEALLLLADLAQHDTRVYVDMLPMRPVHVHEPALAHDAERLTRSGAAWLVSEQRQIVRAVEVAAREGWPGVAADLADRASHLDLDVFIGSAGLARLHALASRSAQAVGDTNLALRMEHHRLSEAAKNIVDAALIDDFRRCAEGLEAIGDTLTLACHLATWAYYQSVYDGKPAVDLAERAATLAREAGDESVYLSALREHASMVAWAGRMQDALPLFEEAIALSRTQPDKLSEAQVQHRISMYALRNGDLTLAAETSRKTLDLLADTHDLRATAYVLSHASRVDAGLGNHDSAIARARRAYEIFTGLAEGIGSATAAANVAESYLAADRPAEASAFLETAIPAHEGVGAAEALERMSEALIAARRASRER
ncbi:MULTISPECIES: AfsR/SARP family transcriptional regulator [unclassified Saccharothrix]|uniref:AfsR/SARP family transcriptional regulator n=1 Tax=unclassified Saccharothrix TaxID=2593673 RepID=UPI00307D5B8E